MRSWAGCRDNKLGVVTYEGRQPTPHRLRHSMGTLNTESLGLRMTIYEMMARLRHEDYRTTHRIYIADNPLLRKQRHIAMLERAGRGTAATPPATTVPDPVGEPKMFTMTEDEALGALARFRVTKAALRKYARHHRVGARVDGAWLYSEAFLHDLAANWISKAEAAEMLGFTRASERPEVMFHHWARRNGVRRTVIGKASLVRSGEVLEGIGQCPTVERCGTSRNDLWDIVPQDSAFPLNFPQHGD